jgi:hypothetical protein
MMKHIFCALACTMAFSAGVAADEGDVWSIATSTRPSDGHRIIYRYRSQFAPSFQRASFPDRVVIVWKYASASGLPSTAERESMDRLEDLLAPHVEKTGVSTLVLVTTGEGLRQWFFYASSHQEFMARLNQALHGEPRFPIEIDLASDPKWTRFDTFKQPAAKQ